MSRCRKLWFPGNVGLLCSHSGIKRGIHCQIKRPQHSPPPPLGVNARGILSPLCLSEQERGDGFLMCQTEKKTKVSFAGSPGPRLVICHSGSDAQHRGGKLGTCATNTQNRQLLQTSKERLRSPGTGLPCGSFPGVQPQTPKSPFLPLPPRLFCTPTAQI